MSAPFTGGCACGAVRYRCSAEPMLAGHCQCRECQKRSGSGHGSFMLVPKPALEVTGELRFHEYVAESGNQVAHGFCPSCGVPVYARSSGFDDALVIDAGSLDDPSLFRPSMVVFTDRAPAWDHLDPDLPRFATLPPMDAPPGQATSS